jgi:hypothetical protein
MSGSHGHSVADDRRPAFMGLGIGAVVVFVILYGVVLATNAKFRSEGHGAEGKPAAAQASH